MSFRPWRHATVRVRFRARRRPASRSRGQALVELALILPVALLLVAAALDLGRLFYSRITVNDAAREGALEAARNPGSFLAGTPCTSANKESNRVMCRTLNEAKGSFVTVGVADVELACSTASCPPTTPALGDTVSVKVTGHFTLLTPLIGVFFGGQDVTFSSTSSAQLNAAPSVPTGAPVAAFTASPTSGPATLNVTFTDTSTGSPATWTWDFGDGQTASTQGPHTHAYTAPGAYTVRLTVSNAGGTTFTTRVISVSTVAPGPPTAAFAAAPTNGSAPLSVTFTDASSGSPTSWAWDFGDGNSSTAQNPVHVYNALGTFVATLTVTNADGSDSTSQTITTTSACAAPVASFNVNPTSGVKRVTPFNVTDTSTNMSTAGCNNKWSWDFGDGEGSSLQDPPDHVYKLRGTYTIQLTVSNSAGDSTTSRTVTVSNLGGGGRSRARASSRSPS